MLIACREVCGARQRLEECEERIHVTGQFQFTDNRRSILRICQQHIEAEATYVGGAIRPLSGTRRALNKQLTINVVRCEAVGGNSDNARASIVLGSAVQCI